MKISWPKKRLLIGWADCEFFFVTFTTGYVRIDMLTITLSGQINKTALWHDVNFFDFAGLRLDLAFRLFSTFYSFIFLRLDVLYRRFCGKLYLKGETQQVDRILE